MDFSKADIFDRRWWLCLEWRMDQLEERNLREVYRQQHLHSLLLLPVSSEETIKVGWDKAHDLLDRYASSRFPWLKLAKPSTQSRTTSIQQLADTWEEIWGKQSDPDTQQRIQNTVRALTPRRARTG